MSHPNNQVLIYTDHPEHYQDSNISKHMDLKFCSCPTMFCNKLLGKDYSGMILNVRKIMQTSCCDRNRILSISTAIPTIRSVEKQQKTIFIDDHENFICACMNRKCNPEKSSCRINVNFPVEISLENDPAMYKSVHGTVHYLSVEGCSFHTEADLMDNNFLFLKISSLKNKLPIFCGVYTEQSSTRYSCGYMVKFLDVKPDQKNEIDRIVHDSEKFKNDVDSNP
ncbi:PilZ domain-containing protein [Maridesulfovibrio sp.]|uniref:PilZ domain-containing protein n=1 Tax=Maridesulfovibrio sp. TaxID=2795000 RepID=UPI0039EF7524